MTPRHSHRPSPLLSRPGREPAARARRRSGGLFAGYLYETAVVLALIAGTLGAGLLLLRAQGGFADVAPPRPLSAADSGLSSRGDDAPIRRMALSPTDETCVIADQRGRLWSCSFTDGRRTRLNVAEIGDSQCVACDPRGRLVLVGDMAGTVAALRRADFGREFDLKQAHNQLVSAIACSPDSRLAASGDAGGLIRLWDLDSGHARSALRGHTGMVQSIRFSDDGRRLLTASTDGSVRQWRVEDGAEVARYVGATTGTMDAVFVGERQIVSAGLDLKLRLWDGPSQTLLHCEELGSSVMTLAIAPDGTIACGCLDGTIRLWSAKLRAVTTEVDAHERGVRSLAFAADGRTLHSAGYDGQVTRWDAATMRKIARIH